MYPMWLRKSRQRWNETFELRVSVGRTADAVMLEKHHSVIHSHIYLCLKSITHVSPRNFPIEGEVANLLRTC